MFRYIFVTLLLISQSLFGAEVKTLHALIIGDPSCLPNLESPELQAAHKNDVARMQDCMQNVAFQADMNLKMTVLTDERVTSRNVNQWINSLPKNSQDTVFVYYSGRETPVVAKKSHYPAVTTYNAAKNSPSCILEEAIFKRVRAKKPRLTLVFFDCYEKMFQGKEFRAIPFTQKRELNGLKVLFAKSAGYILQAITKAGVHGYGIRFSDGQSGGLFTHSLCEMLQSSWGREIYWGHIFTWVQMKLSVVSPNGPRLHMKENVRVIGRKHQVLII